MKIFAKTDMYRSKKKGIPYFGCLFIIVLLLIGLNYLFDYVEDYAKKRIAEATNPAHAGRRPDSFSGQDADGFASEVDAFKRSLQELQGADFSAGGIRREERPRYDRYGHKLKLKPDDAETDRYGNKVKRKSP